MLGKCGKNMEMLLGKGSVEEEGDGSTSFSHALLAEGTCGEELSSSHSVTLPGVPAFAGDK